MDERVPGAPTEGATLEELAELCDGELRAAGARVARGAPAGALKVRGVHQDSRRVAAGDLFVALRGNERDGLEFVAGARERGAVAVLTERGTEVASDLPAIHVADPRHALARAAVRVYGDPSAELAVVGITGTNGKTTTVHLVEAAVTGAGGAPGVVGTLGARFRGWEEAIGLTSPESDDLQRLARRMLDDGASHLLMEVSSIALEAERVSGTRFAVAAFTNLTQDHLDYHGTMAAYASAKDRLFFDHAPRAAVINIDDAHGAELARRIERAGDTPLWRVSAGTGSGGGALIQPEELSMSAAGIRMRVALGEARVDLASPLVGAHNVSNLLVALGIAVALGLDPRRAAAGLAALDAVPGRLERCDDPAHDDVVAVVDYAHTPDALARALASMRPLTRGRLWCVFGCGGDRDPDKRGPMGEAAGRAADAVVVTSDNPRSEDPSRIARAVAAGVERSGRDYQVELDRRRAIALAIDGAAPGDVVVIAGKGHETYQIVGDQVLALDDRVELRACLARRRSHLAGSS
jgi:UDP-N-acetylmuramoyl-L-alanyl-D-glutamate--2,6-diaminopimelate ligase